MVGQGDELVEVLDADGVVIRLVSRGEMRARNLRHRSVGVVVRRPGDGAVLCHRRAPWKDVWPSRWDLAFGGVCDPGEDYATAAVRELAEEAGIDVAAADLRPLGAGAYEDDEVRVLAVMFEVDHGGPFSFPDGEVAAAEWVPCRDVTAWAAGRPVCPDTTALALPRLR